MRIGSELDQACQEYVANQEAAVKSPQPLEEELPPDLPTPEELKLLKLATPVIPGLEQTVPVTGVAVVADGVGVSVGNPDGVKQGKFELFEPAAPVTIDEVTLPFRIDLDQPFPVDGRVLHRYLDVGRKFATWVQERIERFGLEEGVHYACREGRGAKGRPTKEYGFTSRAAAWITPATSERGRQVIRNFRACDPPLTDVAAPPVVDVVVPEAATPPTPVVDVPVEPPVVEPEVVVPASAAILDADTGELIPHELGGIVVYQRAKDGYVNATAMCKAAGKMIGHWSRNAETKKVLDSLSSAIGIPIRELVIMNMGGRPEEQGTWVHPKVAIHLATWCDSDFYAQVCDWVYEWGTTGKAPQLPDLNDPDALLVLLHESTGRLITVKAELAAVNESLAVLGNDLAHAKDEVTAAAKRAQEIEEFNAELVARLESPKTSVRLWDFWKLTVDMLGMSRTVGYEYYVYPRYT